MDRGSLLGFIMVSFLMGCAGMDDIGMREEKFGTRIPVISRSFASPAIPPGEDWKVYLKAFDLNGDMKYIVCQIDQAGGVPRSAILIRIPVENRGDLSGFVYLATRGILNLEYVSLNLKVQIQDMAGHYSKVAAFSLSFNPGAIQNYPPLGAFQEKNLGPINIRLYGPHEIQK